MKRMLIIGLMTLSLLTGLVAGCTDKQLSDEDIEQLVSDVLVANAEVETVKFDINTTSNMEMIGGPEPGSATMAGDGSGAIDSANREMQIIMNMDIDVPGETSKSVPMESYLVDGWMHIKVTVEEKGAQWMKMALPDEMWDNQNQLEGQVELLRTADEVNFFGNEDINGKSCYVVEIVPSTETINQMMSQIQLPDIEGADMSKINFADMIKELSFKQWIAEDGYLIMKSATYTVMELLPDNVGADEEEFQKITVNQTSEMVFYDYNEPVVIELPVEALE